MWGGDTSVKEVPSKTRPFFDAMFGAEEGERVVILPLRVHIFIRAQFLEINYSDRYNCRVILHSTQHVSTNTSLCSRSHLNITALRAIH